VFVLRKRRQYSGPHIRVRRAERFKRFASDKVAPTDRNRAATRAMWAAKVSTTLLRKHTGQRFQADTSTESGEDSVGVLVSRGHRRQWQITGPANRRELVNKLHLKLHSPTLVVVLCVRI
jgi:hypothetical protein